MDALTRSPLASRFAAVVGAICVLQLLLAQAIAGESRLPVLLAVVVVFVLAAAIEPRIAFVGPFFYLLLSFTESGRVTPADAILLIGPVMVGISALTGGELAHRAGRLLASHAYKLAVIAFAVLVVVAVVKALNSGAGEGATAPARMAFYPVLLLSLAVFRDRSEILNALRLCFYAATLYLFLLAMYLLATGGTATTSSVSTGGERVVANSSAMYAVMALALLALHLGQDDRLVRRIGLAALMLMSVATIVLSLARASWAACAVVVLALLVASPTARRGFLRFGVTVAPAVLILALIAPLVAAEQLESIRNRVDRPDGPVQRDQSAETRATSWSLMLDLWRESPVLGRGFGQRVTYEGNDETTKVVVNDPHNGFIFLLVAMGVVGLAAFLLVQVGFLGMAARAIRGPPIGREIAGWAVAAWFVFMVNTFLGVLLPITTFSVFLWTLLSIPVALAALPERRDGVEPEPRDAGPQPAPPRRPAVAL